MQALETNVAEDAQDVVAFYAQPPAARATRPTGTILAVQADGKGVAMIQPPPANPPLRLGKGQKRTKKKEAIVTSLDTIAPCVRTPAHVRATLAGKAAAIETLQQRATQRDGPQMRARVALTDGAENLQQQMLLAFPTFTLILDIIHASEYVWDTATALLGETSPARTAWVAAKLDLVLHGHTATVITQLTEEAADPTWTDAQRKAIQRTVGYYARNQVYMRYDHYLAQG